MKKRIFALLIGINQYTAPIPPLIGCVKDVNRIKAYLQNTYPDTVNIKTLINEEATYHNLIDTFRTHFRDVGSQDTVWFHFSGHGTQSYTARQFIETVEPSGKDECLVCYRAENSSEPYLLADKEMAVLLHEVATRNDESASPHMVVSLDCCHSGSGTRYINDTEVRTRNAKIPLAAGWQEAEKAGETRSITSYIDGYYEQNGTAVPLAKHILLSACENFQTAGDLSGGGIFTTYLMDMLEQAKGEINYVDLFMRTRASTRNRRDSQLPKFEVIGDFDPYTRFLAGTPMGGARRYEVLSSSGKMRVKCGAINGLPIFPEKAIEIEIRTAVPDDQFVARGQITSVGVQTSEFILPGDKRLDEGVTYQAIIKHLPQDPINVLLRGEDEAAIQELTAEWDESKNIFCYKEGEGDVQCQLEVEASQGRYYFRDLRTGILAHWLSIEPQKSKKVMECLEKMVRWERIRKIYNRKDTLEGKLKLEMEVIFQRNIRKKRHGKEIRIYFSDQESFKTRGALVLGFMPGLKSQPLNTKLYCYLLHLRADYSITIRESEVLYNATDIQKKLYKKEMAWGMKEGQGEVSSYFQLLVANKQLDYQLLLQSDLGGDKASLGGFKFFKVEEQWSSLIMKINLIRLQAAISPQTTITLADGKMLIHGNDLVRAKVALSSTHGVGDSNSPAAQFKVLEDQYGKLLNFGEPAGLLPQNVLELYELEVTDRERLKDEPLTISLAESLNPQGKITPVAFDGNDFIIIGESVVEGNNTMVYINQLPDVLAQLPEGVEWVENPFNTEDKQHRSLYETLKVAFYKC
jgi:hypothetical protein